MGYDLYKKVYCLTTPTIEWGEAIKAYRSLEVLNIEPPKELKEYFEKFNIDSSEINRQTENRMPSGPVGDFVKEETEGQYERFIMDLKILRSEKYSHLTSVVVELYHSY